MYFNYPHQQISTWKKQIWSIRSRHVATAKYSTLLQIKTKSTENEKILHRSSLQKNGSAIQSELHRSSLRRRAEAPTVATVGLQKHRNNLSRINSTPASAASKPATVYSEFANPSSNPDLNFSFWRRIRFVVVLLVMALSLSAIATFTLLILESEFVLISVSAAAEGVQITYGSVIKLKHEKTKVRLHSHDMPYGSGSGQQSVTGFPNVDDSNSYWVVRATPDSSAKQGEAIKSGSVIRLQHMTTRKWLHSHLHTSPLSGNLEVSCFGSDGESDTGDHWRLEVEGSGKTWRQDQRIRLQHLDTSGYLHSHKKKYTRIPGGQQEVCGVREKRAESVWFAAEGVYLPVAESK